MTLSLRRSTGSVGGTHRQAHHPSSGYRREPLRRQRPLTLVTTTKSDSHTWNLVYLELVLKELGHDVVNLGPCVPVELLAGCAREVGPDLVVVSTVNGHGVRDGIEIAGVLRQMDELARTPIVIGGKLSTSGEAGASEQARRLRHAGYDAVFGGTGAISAFRAFVAGAGVRA
ncbi:cobalamin B12-binding domain-containing protein [Kineosporia mesophila]|uniref:Cobalamin B12-binding domain-containing protein n=1 Tax=Kineosporia mesophila TaxID=566012 RepID=A0ABP6Z8U5_9ACTN|nr:cobalamin B12-binding domain-containing protein [Kineosporia mesophila]MCD5352130.1 cobalamin B12-binding domain-containing protein [Kineosporia mesophila]